MELRFYATVFSLLLVFLPSICTGQDFNVKESTSLSLRDAIREVAEVTNVLPLDVYSGTTLSEYRNWNCRYDLTYSEFRPNYALYEIARNASVSEVLECVEALADMSAKEKALTCAALIAFVESQREREARGIVPATGLNDDEKSRVLQKLEQELNDRAVAFPKADNAELNARWEAELLDECHIFMLLCQDKVTATSACVDLFRFPPRRSEELVPRYLKYFATWNNETKQLPAEFLCALVLAQAAHMQELWEANIIERSRNDEKATLFATMEEVKRNAVEKCFRSSQGKTRGLAPELLVGADPNERAYSYGECLIMNAYLRTQFIALRAGTSEGETPVDGNSSAQDVLVSEVVRKTLGALRNDTLSAETSCALETRADDKSVEERARVSLLESLRNTAEGSTYFSLPLFIGLYKMCEQEKSVATGPGRIDLSVTYERSRPFFDFFEVAKEATHDEVVESLTGFDKLSDKEKAFALASICLYIARSENGAESNKSRGIDELRPLSDAEKEIFTQCVRRCSEDANVVWDSVQGTMEEWESSFRALALEYQKTLGKWNPYYVYTRDAEERWTRFCNEAPTVLLYSMLLTETCCDLSDLRAFSDITADDLASTNKLPGLSSWLEGVNDEGVMADIRRMRYYLYLNSDLARRAPDNTNNHGSAPSPRFTTASSSVRLCDVVRQMRDLVPESVRDLIPEK